MFAGNESLFVQHLLVAGVFLLIAARLGRIWLTALIVICTVLMNIAVFKSITLFGLPVTGGNVLYATVFLANDVLNEHFGRRAARRAVLIGFGGGLAVIGLMQYVLWYIPNEFDEAQEHLTFFFNAGAYPRVVIASMLCYLTSQLLDTQVYHFIRRKTGPDRLLWLRSNASTWVSQAFDTVAFTTIALTGFDGPLHTWQQWGGAVVFAYAIKIALAAVDTSFLYLTTWRPLIPVGSTRNQGRAVGEW